MYKAFDAYPTLDARGVFLDMSKAFDKVWHEGLIYKLKSMGVSDLLTFSKLFNKQISKSLTQWSDFRMVACKSRCATRSILGPLLFLIYINDLSENIESTVKLFSDDTSLYSVVHNNNTSAEILNRDLQKISQWSHKWKMSFNPDVSKQAQEVIFSRKQAKSVHPDLVFNNTPVHQTHYQKHLGVYLDMKLKFKLHIKEHFSKAMKGICIIKKLSNVLPRKSLTTIYKSFVRPHLDYGDLIYDQPNNESFCQEIESVQYNASLAITGAIKGTSRLKLYNEIGLESLKLRQWFRKLCTFYKIKSTGFPSY